MFEVDIQRYTVIDSKQYIPGEKLFTQPLASKIRDALTANLKRTLGYPEETHYPLLVGKEETTLLTLVQENKPQIRPDILTASIWLRDLQDRGAIVDMDGVSLIRIKKDNHSELLLVDFIYEDTTHGQLVSVHQDGYFSSRTRLKSMSDISLPSNH